MLGAALASLGGSAIGAAGNIAGGLLSQGGLNSGDMITSFVDPELNRALQAYQFDSLNQIGFGDPSDIITPFEELVGRIQSLPIDEKTKRRALVSLENIRQEEPEKRPGRLTAVLTRLGINRDEVADIVQRTQQVTRQRQDLRQQLEPLNQQTILDRARAAAAANSLIGAAGQFAATGQAQSPFQQQLLDRVNRELDRQEEQTLLRANFGGFSPAAAIGELQRARQDAELTAIAQSLQTAGALSQALGVGNQIAGNASGQSTNAAQNAASIAAQQAMAINSLRQQSSLENAQSMGNAISGAASTLGSGIADAGMLSALFGGRKEGGGSNALSDGGQSAFQAIQNIGANPFAGPLSTFRFGQ